MRTRDYNNPKRLAILQVLRENPSMGLRTIAKVTGQSVTNVLHHVRALEADGIFIRTPQRPGRRAQGTDKKKSDSGRKGRGANAFVPRVKTVKDTGIEARIEEIVRRAWALEAKIPGYDVVNHEKRRLRLGKAVKVG
jgi:DNA-binding Lrp family transcriptional regulator